MKDPKIKAFPVRVEALETLKPRSASRSSREASPKQLSYSPKLRLVSPPPAKIPQGVKVGMKPTVKQRMIDGMKRLEMQAALINQLSAELESAVLELKAISREVNLDWRAMQMGSDVFQHHSAAVPHARRQLNGSFMLTMQPVDLLKAEREAALLAQQLRQKTSRKRLTIKN